ncbi:MAG: ATP-binding protein [bacterium]|nr:ATP-binding protein [bacterium]
MKDFFHRDLLDTLKKWIDRREIYAIKGPRQSGKTTLLEMLREWLIEERGVDPEAIVFLTFEDRDIVDSFSSNPKEFVKSYTAKKKGKRCYFFIDEFHYLKDGGRILKLLYDLFRDVKFVITGSSSLELTGETAKYLVGRVFFFYLWQLSFKEFIQVKAPELLAYYEEKSDFLRRFIQNGVDFSPEGKDIFLKDFSRYFEEYANWGGYPEVVKSNDRETKSIILKNIYETYVTKDIIELLKITDAETFRKIVSLLANQTGNILSFTSLIQDTGTYFKEMKNKVSILEETYIIKLIQPFYTNRTTELKKSPKVYFIDTGLRNSILHNFSEIYLRPDRGALVENAVLSILRTGYAEEDVLVRYWRTLSKAEVDFVLRFRDSVIPIEVKYSHAVPKISRSFRSFLSSYNPERAVILTRDLWGKERVNNTFVKFVPLWYI